MTETYQITMDVALHVFKNQDTYARGLLLYVLQLVETQ